MVAQMKGEGQSKGDDGGGNVTLPAHQNCSGNEVRPAYEPPALRRLGTLAELTRGAPSADTDGFGPGSAIAPP